MVPGSHTNYLGGEGLQHAKLTGIMNDIKKICMFTLYIKLWHLITINKGKFTEKYEFNGASALFLVLFLHCGLMLLKLVK